VQKFKGQCQEMTDETGMSFAAAERKKQMVQIAHHQESVPEDRGSDSDRKRATGNE